MNLSLSRLNNLPLQERNKFLEQIKHIYFDSFPIDERRPWGDWVRHITAPTDTIFVDGVFDENNLVGFITSWQFDKFAYIEHFAIDARLRCGGMGRLALQKFLDSVATPVLLEVEPPESSPLAQRRLNFYKRLGFEVISTDYVQPPYTQELPSVPLYLMSTAPLDVQMATITLHQKVYGAI